MAKQRISEEMTQYLPLNLFALFAPRDPIPYLPPPCKLPHEKQRKPFLGLNGCLSLLEKVTEPPVPVEVESIEQRRERKRLAKMMASKDRVAADLEKWDPKSNSEATSDPYRTLFVGRINYDTPEYKLRREFEAYGKISQIKIINDPNNGRPRGYAFIEYERESDMHDAFRKADGRKIDGRRVVVDVERGRTVKGWVPRRLGGGLGGTRRPRSTSPSQANRRGSMDNRRHDSPPRQRNDFSAFHGSHNRRPGGGGRDHHDDFEGGGGGGGPPARYNHRRGGGYRNDQRSHHGGSSSGNYRRSRYSPPGHSSSSRQQRYTDSRPRFHHQDREYGGGGGTPLDEMSDDRSPRTSKYRRRGSENDNSETKQPCPRDQQRRETYDRNRSKVADPDSGSDVSDSDLRQFRKRRKNS